MVETEDVNACADCHGERGAEPDREKHPTLAGQLAAYTYKQMRDYKDGSRKNRKMKEAIERLTDEQLAALAAWYAKQPIPKVEVDEEETVSEDTLKLVFRGDKTRLIQPCASCHGARGEGAIIDVPAIAGQNVKYFVNTMKDYAKGKRANDIYSRMRIIAKELTRDEINELAVYYARLGGKPGGGGLFQAFAN
jgi:cytochrome c553